MGTGKPSRSRDVDWLDRSTSPLDIEACEVWPASRGDPLCPRLYKTPSGRWVLDPGGDLLEVPLIRAAHLLLAWGWPLAADLLREWDARHREAYSPGEAIPLPVARSRDDLVVLYGPLDEPLVLGKPKPPLGPIPHKIIRTIIEAGDPGLNLYELRKQSGHGGARNVLRKTAKEDADWRSVIQFPGQARWGGYRIGPPGLRHCRAEAN